MSVAISTVRPSRRIFTILLFVVRARRARQTRLDHTADADDIADFKIGRFRTDFCHHADDFMTRY